MKRLISKFSDKLLSNQQLKTVKGGTQYCNCGPTGPIPVGAGESCSSACGEYYNNGVGGGYWEKTFTANHSGNGYG